MKTKIICTLGPSSFSPKILNQLKSRNVDIFRINLSHTPKNDILNKINYLKKNKNKLKIKKQNLINFNSKNLVDIN